MILIDYLFIVSIAIGLIYALISLIFLFIEHRVRKSDFRQLENYPAVSVFKPIKGLDDGLENNLKSFFELDYPAYELVFGIQDHDDPAISLVRRLQRKYPHVPSQLIINPARIGLNPKINNLYNIYPYANHDYMVISDSNVRVEPGYLTDLIGRLQTPGVGLVTSAIRGVGGESLGSVFENLHLNTYISGSVHTVQRLFGIPLSIGKSMCFHRVTLKTLGGFEAFANYLAEDYLLGDAIRKMGKQVVVSNRWIDSVNHTWGVRRFINRHFRWATMRRHVNLLHYSIEIFSNPVVLALLYYGWRSDRTAGIFLIAVTIFKMLADIAAARLFKSDLRWYHYLYLPLKDIIIGGIWLAPFLKRQVVWRGNYFNINRNTCLTPALENRNSLSTALLPLFESFRQLRFACRRTVNGSRRLFIIRPFFSSRT